MTAAGGDRESLDRIKSLLVDSLWLKVPAASIGDDQPLFERDGGLGLDSIDVLELVVALEKTFGVVISDQEVGRKVLRTPRSIADFVRSHAPLR